MALDQLLRLRSQRLRIQRTLQPPHRGDVVGGLVGQQPVQKPQPLLRKRQRQIARARHRHNRSASPVSPAPSIFCSSAARADTVAVSKKRRSGSSSFRSLPRRATTWAASSEWPPNSKKLSCTPTCSSFKTSRQTPATSSSSESRGATYVPPRRRAIVLRRRQRLPVNLAVGQNRQRVQEHERARYERLGQLLRQVGTQVARVELLARSRDYVADQMMLAVVIRGAQPRRSCGRLRAGRASLSLLPAPRERRESSPDRQLARRSRAVRPPGNDHDRQ